MYHLHVGYFCLAFGWCIWFRAYEKYIIDAKWKILNKEMKHAEFYNDVSKLRRDAKIRNAAKGYLIYPKFDVSSKFQLDTEYKYDFDDFVFELKVINVT